MVASIASGGAGLGLIMAISMHWLVILSVSLKITLEVCYNEAEMEIKTGLRDGGIWELNRKMNIDYYIC